MQAASGTEFRPKSTEKRRTGSGISASPSRADSRGVAAPELGRRNACLARDSAKPAELPRFMAHARLRPRSRYRTSHGEPYE